MRSPVPVPVERQIEQQSGAAPRPARKGRNLQILEQLQPVAVARHCLRVKLAGEIGEHHAVAGKPANRDHIRLHLAHEGLARHGDADIAAPGMRQFHLGQFGIDLGDLPADGVLDVAGVGGRIDFAPPEQQPTIARLAKIAHHEARIVDALTARQDWTVATQGDGGADEGTDRHDMGG